MEEWGAYLAYGCNNVVLPANIRLANTTPSNDKLFDKLDGAFRVKLCLSKFSSRIAVEFLRSRLCLHDGPIRLKRVLGYVLDVLNNLNQKMVLPKGIYTDWQSGCPNIIRGLRAYPIWDTSEFPWIRVLEEASAGICLELMGLRGQKSFQPYRSPISEAATELPSSIENKHHEIVDSLGALGTTTGDWNVCYLHLHGLDVGNSLQKCPITAAVIEAIPRHYRHAFFSALAPSTHVAKHHGSTNKKLRCHLPLKVPRWDKNTENVSGLTFSPLSSTSSSIPSLSPFHSLSSLPPSSYCWLRVADKIIELQEGVAVVFDDSFEHEAANEHRTDPRIVLVVDFWHPDFTDEEVKFLEFINKGQMSSLKSGILHQTSDSNLTEEVTSVQEPQGEKSVVQHYSADTRIADKMKIEVDNFLTVIRKAKENSHKVYEPNVWGV